MEIDKDLAEYGYLELCDLDITQEKCSKLSNDIRLLNIKNNVKNIILVIDSYGGDVFAANHLMFAIKGSKIPVIGIAKNLCGSAAVDVLLSCHKKCSLDDTIFLTHSMSFLPPDEHVKLSKIRDFQKLWDAMTQRGNKFYSEQTGFDEKFIKKKLLPDYEDIIFLGQDGKDKFNIVDEIVDEVRITELIQENYLARSSTNIPKVTSYCGSGNYCNCKDEIR